MIDSSKAGWIPIHFSEEEKDKIVQVGSSRRGAKEAAGFTGEKLEEKFQFGHEGHALTFGAEWALSKLLGVEPDTEISYGGNSGVHMTFERKTGKLDEHSFQEVQEITFNAAWVSDATWDLKFSPNRIPDAEVFVLLTGTLDKMSVVGGISKSTFQMKCKERDYGHGLRLAVGQADLTPIRKVTHWLGLSDRVDYLDGVDKEKRLRHQEKFGSLFNTRQHKDPA